MTTTISRIQFLSGDLDGRNRPLRPPWALPEEAFIERCTRCGDCISTCPYGLIKEGRGKYPQLDFSQAGCDFCRECVKACEPEALVYDAAGPPWKLKATILPNCLSLNAVICRACGEACEAQAIQFRLELGGVARPLLDLGLCTGCGECYAVCPIRAVNISPMVQERAA